MLLRTLSGRRLAAPALVLALLAGATQGVQPAGAQETGDPAEPAPTTRLTLPPIADFEDPEFQPMYDGLAADLGGQLVDGRLLVPSKRLPGDGNQVFYDLDDRGARGIFVDVTADFSGVEVDYGLTTGPGLVLRRPDGPALSFLAFSIGPDFVMTTTWVDGAVIDRRISALPPGVDPAARPVQLAAREFADSGAIFYLNGVPVEQISISGIEGRRIGVAVFGPGTFTFDNLSLNTVAAIDEAGLGLEPVAVGGAVPPPGLSPEMLFGRWRTDGPLPFGDDRPAEGHLLVEFHPDGAMTMSGELTRFVNGTPVAVTAFSTSVWSAVPGPDRDTLVVRNTGTSAFKSDTPHLLPPERFEFDSDETVVIIDADTIVIGGIDGDRMVRLVD